MMSGLPRRTFLQFASSLLPAWAMNSAFELLGPASPSSDEVALPVRDVFPSQPPELVRETLVVAHFDLKRIKELVGARPSLARAAWDWGFGDWESALGAASHTGNRAIAEYLISQGARPSLFSAAMLGQLEVVKAFVAAQPQVERIRGPHGISLLAHAKAGGEAARPVFEFLKTLGDADADPPVPLSESDIAAIVGTYTFGPSAVTNQQIDVTADKGQLLWTRKGTTGRTLYHLGDRVFHPAGAPAARISFADDKAGIVMTVRDPDLVLTARKVGARV